MLLHVTTHGSQQQQQQQQQQQCYTIYKSADVAHQKGWFQIKFKDSKEAFNKQALYTKAVTERNLMFLID